MAANKKPSVGHVVYDSGTDQTSGKKRAVLPGGGGMSVADRARLFGDQVQRSAPAKTYNSASHLPQRPPPSAQPTKSNVPQQERNYQPPRTDIDRRPKQNASNSIPPRAPPVYRSAAEVNERRRREPVSAFETNHYSKAPSSYNQKSHSPPRRRPVDSYDNFQHVSSQRQPSYRAKPPQRMPSESYTSEDEDTYSALYEKQIPSRSANYQSNNYFRPIRDPLDVLFKDSPHEYIQHQVVMQQPPKEAENLQAFDLGSLINRIQQDYADHARPYVSSVQFVQHDQSLANIGLVTPMAIRKDYVRRPVNNYSRQVPPSSHRYDVIDTNGFNPYEKMYSRSQYDDNHYSSIRRRRHHKHYHNQASSPIHILETSSKANLEPKLATPAPPKVPTPAATSSSEEEEAAPAAVPPAAKAEETESSSEEEEEESEEESAPALSVPTPLQTVNGPNRPPGTLPNGATRPPLPNQTPTTAARNPPPANESEETDSDESDSNSDTESDSDDDDKKKPKPKPTPVARPAPQRTTPSTPQTPLRVAPQRTNYESNSLNEPPESSHSVRSFDVQESGKTSLGGKLKSFTSKFRRNKS